MYKEKGYLWLLTTEDKYELPLVVAESLGELAEKIGVRENTISSAISHSKRRGNNCRYKKVYVGEEDE